MDETLARAGDGGERCAGSDRSIKEATVKVFHYPSLDSLKAHVLAFARAYNFARHLEALRWRTPFEAICNAWTNDPLSFTIDPRHLIPAPNRSVEVGVRPRVAE
jgi:hypothetical protein